jgi:tRNA nucleotidyltransferase (CCA-adding enzyme)
MKWSVYFLAILRGYDSKISEDIFNRLELAPRLKTILGKERYAAEKSLWELERHMPVSNSELCDQLMPFRPELKLYMMAATLQKRIKRGISNYFVKLRYIKPAVTGEDLKQMGFPPGPVFKEVLLAIQHEKLNGKLKTRDDELMFISRHFAMSEPGTA